VSHKDFEVPERPTVEHTFTLAGRKFRALSVMPMTVRLRMALPVTKSGLAQLVEMMLVEDDEQAWRDLMADKKALVEPEDVEPVFWWLVEEMAASTGEDVADIAVRAEDEPEDRAAPEPEG
jgi:hypothetical protein